MIPAKKIFILLLVLAPVQCIADMKIIYKSEIKSTFSEYILSRERCSDKLSFDKNNAGSDFSFLSLVIGCLDSFGSIIEDLEKLFTKYELVHFLKEVNGIRIGFFNSKESLVEKPWVLLIKEINESNKWPAKFEEEASVRSIYIKDALHVFLENSEWIKPIRTFFKSRGCIINLRGKRDFYTEHVLLLTKQEVINAGILTESEAKKSIYPYSFSFDFSTHCSPK